MKNYHFNKNNQKKYYNNNANLMPKNNQNNDINYNKLIEENKKLKMELHQKANVLKDYNSRLKYLQEQLHQLHNQNSNHKNNFKNTNPINQNNNISHNRVKSNSNLRISNNYSNDPFDMIFNNGLMDHLFNSPLDIFSNGNNPRINPNFKPGDYEDFYENSNVNNFIPTNNNLDESKVEQDIIDQLYPDPDKMTYEQLLQLEENVGSVSKGLTNKQISKIPKVIYNSNKFKKDDNKCVVCQYEFKNGETITKLTCGHIFHSECVNTWLSKNKVCPMCHKEIVIK